MNMRMNIVNAPRHFAQRICERVTNSVAVKHPRTQSNFVIICCLVFVFLWKMMEKKKKFAEPRRGRSINKIKRGRSGSRLCCASRRLYTTSGISFDFGRGRCIGGRFVSGSFLAQPALIFPFLSSLHWNSRHRESQQNMYHFLTCTN